MKYTPLMLLTIVGFLPTQGQAERPVATTLDQKIALLLTQDDAKTQVPVQSADPFAVSQAVQPAKGLTVTCPGCGCTVTGTCSCATMKSTPTAATQYKWVCGPNGCSMVSVPVSASNPMGVTSVMYMDDGSGVSMSSGSSSGGGFLPRVFARIRARRAGGGSGSSGSCASCGQ